MGTSSWTARATVAGAIMGPGQAAKMMLLKKRKKKAVSRFHVGQSCLLLLLFLFVLDLDSFWGGKRGGDCLLAGRWGSWSMVEG